MLQKAVPMWAAFLIGELMVYPNTIFRFRQGAEAEHFSQEVEMLAKNRVWLAPAINFIDKREARPDVIPSSYWELRRAFASMLEEFIGNAEIKGVHMPLSRSHSEFRHHFRDVRRSSEVFLSEAPNFIAAASFTKESSESHDRMWQEYASERSGYSVEYHFQGQNSKGSPFWTNVFYGDNRRSLSEFEVFAMVYQALGLQIYIKHPDLVVGLSQSLFAWKNARI